MIFVTGRDVNGEETCGWTCAKRSEISGGFSDLLKTTEAIRITLRRDELNRPKKNFRIDNRIMRGDEEIWQAGLPENSPLPQDDPVDVDKNILQPLIDNIVDLIVKDEQGERNDLDRIRKASSNLSILAEAFERVATNGGTINENDRKAINQGISGILQLAFHLDFKQSE